MEFHNKTKNYVMILLVLALLGGLPLSRPAGPGSAWAQPAPNEAAEGVPADPVEAAPPADLQAAPVMRPLSEEDELHLNTIGAFSAGFVLQSYGYIGVLADVLSKDVYSPELVREMLGETIKYLRNLDQQLEKYKTADIAAGDRKFIAQIQEIVGLLQVEAEALSTFAKTRDKSELERFENARKNAWGKIKKTLGMS